MRAYELREGFGIDNLQSVERSIAEPGPYEVLVRIKACSLNYRDLLMVNGSYNPRQRLPLIPLSDGIGEVEQVGERVTRVKIGDRVAGIFAQTWLDGPLQTDERSSILGGPLDGVLCGLRVFHQDGLVHVPGHLSDQEAATLPCAAVTAWNALLEQGNVRSADTVLVLGTGGVSLFALQFAKLAGARVIVTSSSDEKLRKAVQLGADDTINYNRTPDWDIEIRKKTDGQGVDHVVEVGGMDTLPKSLNAVKLNGNVFLIGVLSGVVAKIPLTSILMKQVRVQGVLVGNRRMFESMNRSVAQHALKPVVDKVFDFDQAQEAFRYLSEARHFGKVVIGL